jgi:hypothetical protein
MNGSFGEVNGGYLDLEAVGKKIRRTRFVNRQPDDRPRNFDITAG